MKRYGFLANIRRNTTPACTLRRSIPIVFVIFATLTCTRLVASEVAKECQQGPSSPFVFVTGPERGAPVKTGDFLSLIVASESEPVVRVEALVNGELKKVVTSDRFASESGSHKYAYKILIPLSVGAAPDPYLGGLPITSGVNVVMLRAITTSGQCGRESVELVSAFQPITALVIGVSKYEGFPPLRWPEQDASRFANALKEFFSANVTVLLNEDATRRNVAFALERASHQLTPGGTFLLYFSGRSFEDFNGEQSGRRPTNAYYLATFDSSTEFPQSTMFDLRALMYGLAQLPASTYIMILDSSSGPALPFPENLRPANIAVMFCGQATEACYEDDALQGGVLTHFVLEGLRTAATSKQPQGVIEIEDILKQAGDRTHTYVSTSKHASQSPNLLLIGRPSIQLSPSTK